jgi:uncharacterized protein (TIGR03067 family)
MTKTHTFCATLLALLLLGCGGSAPSTAPARSFPDQDLPVVKKDKDRLQGTWEIAGCEWSGTKLTDREVRDMGLQYVFTADKIINRGRGRRDSAGTYLLDPIQSPKRLEASFADDPTKLRAIYDVDGDFLRLCLLAEARATTDYPTDFVSRLFPRATDLYRLQRRKPEPPPDEKKEEAAKP